MANGTLRGESRRYAGREARPASADSARTTRPAKLRVAATLSADVVAIVAASLLAVWVARAFDDVPVISRLIGPFESDPHGGTLTFILLTPFWLAALWAFGLYREPGRSIGGMNLSKSLSGLTALTAASWLMLIVIVFVSGASAPVATPATIDVTAFGAVGNGVSDDSSAINAALAKAKSIGKPVTVPAGDFLLLSTITVPDGVTITGGGESSWLHGAVIFGSDQVFQNLMIGTPGAKLTHKNGAANSRFVTCRIRGGGGYQTNGKPVIGIGGPSGAISNVSFENCLIEANSGTENAGRTLGMNNISIGEVMDDDAHIENLSFVGCTIGAFNGARSGSPRMGVEATSRSWNGGAPRHYIQGLSFVGCTIEACDETALDIESPVEPSPSVGNFLIQGCVIKGGGIVSDAKWGQSVCLELGPGAKVIGNTIYGGKYGALEIWTNGQRQQASLAVVSGNTFDATQGSVPVTNAIHVTASRMSFTSNSLRYSPSRCGGVSLDGGTACTVTGNTFTQTYAEGQPVSQVNGATGNTVSGNTTTP